MPFYEEGVDPLVGKEEGGAEADYATADDENGDMCW